MEAKILSKSPLQKYIDEYDLAHITESYDDYWLTAKKQKYEIWNALMQAELAFRSSHMNNIFSVEGTQGAGKSAFLLRHGQLTAKSFRKKLSLDHVHFFHEDIKKDLDHFKRKMTVLQDEQPRLFGMMSHQIQEELANYEDLYRKPQVNIGYAAPSLRFHEHFFIFEAMGDIYLSEKGEPAAVEIMLKTRRKSDRMIMPRAVLRYRWPTDIWVKYNKKKEAFLKKFSGTKGDRLKILEDYAKITVDKYGDQLYTEMLNGNIRLKKEAVIRNYIDKAVGGGNLTGEGMGRTAALVQEMLLEKLNRR